MAAASTKKLETLLECPICLEKVTEPRLFECLHFYCQPCLGDMKPATEDGVTGYRCPTCRKITPKEKLRPMHFMHELLEIVEMAKKEQAQVCDICKQVPAEQKCLDCKQIFCANCKTQHDRMAMLQNHRWRPLEQGATAVLDKHVYCAKHPQEIVKVHCKDCKALICLICNGTDHKQHSAETIEEALEHTLTTVKQHQREIKKVIAQNETILAQATADMTNVEKQYGDIEREAERKRDEIIRKTREHCDQLKQQVAKTKTAHIDKIQQFITKTDLTLKGQKNMLSLSDTALARAENTSLLQALQSGVTQGLSSNLRHTAAQPTYRKDVAVAFKPAPVHAGNTVGSIVERGCLVASVHPLFNNRPLSEVTTLQTKLVKETDLSYLCNRFAKINKEFYCVDCESSKINVYSEDIEKISEITLKGTGKVWSVAYMDPFLLVGSESGLYHSNTDGSNVQAITTGHITSMCWRGDAGYVLDDKHGTVMVITFSSATKTFSKKQEIKLDSYDECLCNALQVTRDFIYVSLCSANTIHKYKHTGTLLSTHDARDSTIGAIQYPVMCGQDAVGCLLICDFGNQRLVTLSPEGEWQRLQQTGLGKPICAVVQGDSLFVTHESPRIFKKYALV